MYLYFIVMEKYLRIFLVLVAIHSFCVGVGLLFIPTEYFGIFGFNGYQGIFFKIQGGVFHIVMCGAYIPAAINPERNRNFILFAVFAKLTATIFLLSYAFFVEMVWMVMVSGILDFTMGIILILLLRGMDGIRDAGSVH